MKKAKILLIDDDPIFLELSKETLKGVSCLEEINCVNHARDAREYLDSCVQNRCPFPNVIFLDLHMPGIGGMEFAEFYSYRYAEQYPNTKLVMLSSSIRRKEKTKALEFPAVEDFIEKPITVKKLMKVLLED